MKYLYVFFLVFFLVSCNQEQDSPAQRIIDEAIEKAGGNKFGRAQISFSFRETEYSSSRKNGIFKYTRTFKDSFGEVRDVLTNDGFVRYRNGKEEVLSDSLKTLYSNSVNSVHYFVQLPYGLNSPAVQKELVGESEIKGQPYHEIRVTFEQEGGGTDHEDEYMYWIHKEDFTVDYLAYRFFVEEGGIRFRRAYNSRTVEGLRFVDYENYKAENWRTVDLQDLDELFEAGELELVSMIETQVEQVEILED